MKFSLVILTIISLNFCSVCFAHSDIDELYQSRLKLDDLSWQYAHARKPSPVVGKGNGGEKMQYQQNKKKYNKLASDVTNAETDYNSILDSILIFQGPQDQLPKTIQLESQPNVKERLILHDAKIQNGQIFYLDNLNSKSYRLEIANAMKQYKRVDRARASTITCNAPFRIKKKTTRKNIEANSAFHTSLNYLDRHQVSATLYFSSDPIECKLVIGDASITLMSNAKKTLLDLEVCPIPLNANGNVFYDRHLPNFTCPIKTKLSNIQILDEPIFSLRMKAELLLGTNLPDDFIKNQNPFANIDESHLPHFDKIFISYLVFRADFSGNLLARLLELHAKNGTEIKIIISDVMQLDKDQILLDDLASKYSNIKVQEYRYPAYKSTGFKDWLSRFHKTFHVKMLLTTSKDFPENNAVILGGRNIHDGFVFREPPSNFGLEKLVHYPYDERFVYWRDLEVMVHDPHFVSQLKRQFSAVWSRDPDKLLIRPSQFLIPKDKYLTEMPPQSDEAFIRHYISMPFIDDMALEDFYVKTFDSAKSTIWISTPYFNFTKKISNAIERAIDRKVNINVITRIELEGDTAQDWLGEINKKQINKFFKKINIYEYQEKDALLHSKIVIIDERVTQIGSVNLNQRSFYHDAENAIVVESENFAARVKDVLNDYLTQSKLVDERQKTSFWRQTVLAPFRKEF